MRAAGILLLLTVALTADETARIASLVADLGNPSFARRESAQAALIAIGEAALPALHAAQDASDPELRQRAGATVRAIELRMDEARTRLAVERLSDSELSARRRTLAELVATRDPATVVATLERLPAPLRAWALTEILYVETDVDLRTKVVEALLGMDAREAQAGLAWALRDNLGHLRSTVEGGLAKSGRPPISLEDDEPIRVAVARGTAEERVRAIRMVVTGLTTDERAIDAVGAVLTDSDAVLRRRASWAFRFLSPSRHGAALIERALTDAVREVRIEATLALARLPEPPVRTALLELASGAELELARVAASALADVGDAATEVALAALRERTADPGLCSQIDQSLARLRARLAEER